MSENNTNDYKLRREKLEFLYERLFELIIHEGRYVSERTNVFLIFNGVLFAAFSILKVEIQDPNFWSVGSSIGIGTIGIIVSFFS